ncbi:Probable terpene synthase 12 [Linum perenne]
MLHSGSDSLDKTVTNVSQDVFEEFVNEKGVFPGDVKDMLSLYESSYIAYEGEDMLDKANAESTSYLNNFLSRASPSSTSTGDDTNIKELVRHSLEIPLHRRAELVEARWYIEAYKMSKGANRALLELAMLELNMAQSVSNVTSRTHRAFYNTVNDMANETLHTHGSNISPHLVKAWADMLKAFLKEAEWSYDKRGAAPPTFSEYIENGWRSVSGTVILVHAYCFLNGGDDGHVFSKEMLEDHLLSYDEIVRWPSVIFRLCNDLATSSGEIARGETVNAISCYMNENGVSEEEARKHLKSMIDQAWKNMNQELLLLSTVNNMDDDNSAPEFAKSFVRSVFNLARIAHYTYQRGDSHGNPDAGSKKTIFSLIFEPIVNDSKFESLI